MSFETELLKIKKHTDVKKDQRISNIQSQMSSIVNKFNSEESTLQNLKSVENSPNSIRSNLKSHTKNEIVQLKEEVSDSSHSALLKKSALKNYTKVNNLKA